MKKYKVLIVEDDAPIRQLFEFKLSNSGFDVKTAVNGKEGLKVAESFKPNIALVDLMMPEMNGDEMLEKLREKEWAASMRIIVLTNVSKDEAPKSLRFLAVDRYIVKAHYTPGQVVEVVNEVLAGR
jgi:two-component system OmpR family response regulator